MRFGVLSLPKTIKKQLKQALQASLPISAHSLETGMSQQKNTDPQFTAEESNSLSVTRRTFVGGALGAAAGVGAVNLLKPDTAHAQPPGASPAADGAPATSSGPSLFKAEVDVRHCEIDGTIPSGLSGAFYRVGPDPQFPLRQGNIPFDGEGHVSMFRIQDGKVHYKTRFVRNDRWLAQDKAGKLLFPMYRNPYQDDPSVKGLSRSTANTHIINHRNYLLSLKEDSPPAALDLLTLETIHPNYTFDGQLVSQTFTAHPKVDSMTGNMVAFGYEATGFGSDDVIAFEITPQGKKVWEAKVKVPYVGMLHDFAVTENYIVLYVIPMVKDDEQLARGGIHWSWDSTKTTYFGAFRRGGDGSDLRWFNGPERSATHVMGAFDDNGRIYVDVEMSESNPFPFMPMRDGSRWDPVKGTSYITRLSADLNNASIRDYSMERLAPWTGALPRQDDRYNTVPYRYGFLGTRNAFASDPRQANAGYVRFDHATGTQVFCRSWSPIALHR
ncbi:MAG: carotenoid oxygenase family protein [Pseudomonadota bacterium]|nr:carotenoid oxygenase family protein [Pseudomonadota bacterium]